MNGLDERKAYLLLLGYFLSKSLVVGQLVLKSSHYTSSAMIKKNIFRKHRHYLSNIIQVKSAAALYISNIVIWRVVMSFKRFKFVPLYKQWSDIFECF